MASGRTRPTLRGLASGRTIDSSLSGRKNPRARPTSGRRREKNCRYSARCLPASISLITMLARVRTARLDPGGVPSTRAGAPAPLGRSSGGRLAWRRTDASASDSRPARSAPPVRRPAPSPPGAGGLLTDPGSLSRAVPPGPRHRTPRSRRSRGRSIAAALVLGPQAIQEGRQGAPGRGPEPPAAMAAWRRTATSASTSEWMRASNSFGDATPARRGAGRSGRRAVGPTSPSMPRAIRSPGSPRARKGSKDRAGCGPGTRSSTGTTVPSSERAASGASPRNRVDSRQAPGPRHAMLGAGGSTAWSRSCRPATPSNSTARCRVFASES